MAAAPAAETWANAREPTQQVMAPRLALERVTATAAKQQWQSLARAPVASLMMLQSLKASGAQMPRVQDGLALVGESQASRRAANGRPRGEPGALQAHQSTAHAMMATSPGPRLVRLYFALVTLLVSAAGQVWHGRCCQAEGRLAPCRGTLAMPLPAQEAVEAILAGEGSSGPPVAKKPLQSSQKASLLPPEHGVMS